MALAIATNNAALQAAAAASSVNRDMETSMARLSSGKRINSASDDAAGVAISSRLSAEIRGTDQAIRNSLDGQAMIDTAEGAHKEIENILQRMREVAVQAANDTNNDQDRANLQAEMNALVTEIDRIASTTTWAGEKLMESESTKFSFQVGAATGEKNQIEIDIDAMGSDALGLGKQAGSGLGIRVISDTEAHIAAAATEAANNASSSNSSSTVVSNFPASAGTLSGNTFQLSAAALNLGQTGGHISFWAYDHLQRIDIYQGATQDEVAADVASYLGSATSGGLITLDPTDVAEPTYNLSIVDITASAATVQGGNITLSSEAIALGQNGGHLSWTIGGSSNVYSASFPAGSNAEDIALALNSAYPHHFDLGAAYTSGVLRESTSSSYDDIQFKNVGQARAEADARPGTAATVQGGNITLSSEAIALGQNGGHLSWTIGGNSTVYSASFPAGSNAEDIALALNSAYPYHFEVGAAHTDGVLRESNSSTYDDISFLEITSANSNAAVDNSSGSSSSPSSSGSPADNARAAVTLIDDAIRTVNIQRSKLGAVSNRLSHTVNNLTNISSNLSAAQGGIEDADFAKETTDLAKNQILQQASTAMLAQANASKQNVLSLLQG